MEKLFLRRVWLAVVLATLTTALIISVALAHAGVVRSTPADNTILAEPPREVRLWFNEPISPEFSSAEVLDANSQPIELGGIQVDPIEAGLMVVTLPELSPGIYSVRWKVLSEADGHFTQGLLVFGVGQEVDLSNATVPERKFSIPPPEVLLRWLNFSVLLALVGSVAIAYLVLSPTGVDSLLATVRLAAQRRVINWAGWCSGLALAVGIGLLLWQITTLMGTLPEGASVQGVSWQLLSRTRWGTLWLARQGILLVLIGILFLLHRATGEQGSREAWQKRSSPLPFRSSALLLFLAGLLSLALLIIQAFTGHAAALTPNTTLAVVVDALHLLAASLWVGGLLGLIIGLLPLLRRDKANFATLAQAGWGPFSRLAALSVGILLATGLYNTGRQVASVDALVTTLYGQTLLAKIGLMLGVGAFGLLNSILLHPRLAAPLARLLARPSGWTPLSLSRLPTLLLAEAGLGLLVLLATGLITAAPPARGPEFEMAPEDIPTMLSQSADDMLVTFSAKPNRPGQNIFTVRAVSTRRPPPAEVIRVILRFTFMGQDMGRTSADATEIEPGLYQLGGNYLSLAGPWQVQVVVRRRGIEDSMAQFNWIVATPGPARSVVISNRSLEPLLTVAAGGTILLVLLIIAGVWLGRLPWPGRRPAA